MDTARFSTVMEDTRCNLFCLLLISFHPPASPPPHPSKIISKTLPDPEEGRSLTRLGEIGYKGAARVSVSPVGPSGFVLLLHKWTF